MRTDGEIALGNVEPQGIHDSGTGERFDRAVRVFLRVLTCVFLASVFGHKLDMAAPYLGLITALLAWRFSTRGFKGQFLVSGFCGGLVFFPVFLALSVYCMPVYDFLEQSLVAVYSGIVGFMLGFVVGAAGSISTFNLNGAKRRREKHLPVSSECQRLDSVDARRP